LDNPQPGGLSIGAKIGLGVGVPIGVIAALLFFLLWWRRRKQSRAALACTGASYPAEDDYKMAVNSEHTEAHKEHHGPATSGSRPQTEVDSVAAVATTTNSSRAEFRSWKI
jgi:hypothetical protein